MYRFLPAIIRPFPSVTETVKTLEGAFLKSSPTTLTGRTASPSSSTRIPREMHLTDVFRSVASRRTVFSSSWPEAFSSMPVRELMVLFELVLLSAICQFFMNSPLLI